MLDAHFHRNTYDTFLAADGAEWRFLGLHPWQVTEETDAAALARGLAAQLAADPRAGVGEIGLDRLRTREIPPCQRAALRAQLETAAACRRPVVLHGAKCWGEVVKACAPHRGAIPAFLFHGFSRSAGLLPEIAALNGFVSVGPAILNDHAVNYRALARELPLERLLVETDADAAADPAAPSAGRVLAGLAAVRGVTDAAAFAAALADNARRFVEALA